MPNKRVKCGTLLNRIQNKNLTPLTTKQGGDSRFSYKPYAELKIIDRIQKKNPTYITKEETGSRFNPNTQKIYDRIQNKALPTTNEGISSRSAFKSNVEQKLKNPRFTTNEETGSRFFPNVEQKLKIPTFTTNEETGSRFKPKLEQKFKNPTFTTNEETGSRFNPNVEQKLKNPTFTTNEETGSRFNPNVEQRFIDTMNITEEDLHYKHPIMILNELGTGFAFKDLYKFGEQHKPIFVVNVTVADLSFEGWGNSKREARASAARACLEALLARAGRVLPSPNAPQDFTNDEPANRPSDFQCLEAKMLPPKTIPKQEVSSPVVSIPSSTGSSPASLLFGTATAAAVHKSPINLLYENYPGLVFTCTFGDGSPLESLQVAPVQLSHSMRFKVVCQIKEQKFEGYGSSKKQAKVAAARSALAVLDEGRVDPSPTAATPAGFLPQTLADHVGKLVNEKFNDLMKGDLVHSKRKVLAGIVITINNRPEGAKVITVTTGTKCVSGEHMSVRGRAVNDCHAEVAARRCLQRHLYTQLLQYANAKDPKQTIPDSDLEPLPTGGYQLKPDRQVHLYVSTAPCGDGRIFSPHEQQETEPDRHPNRLARGQLRTKIESGEGTIPVKNCSNVLQTWDGVLQGERLLTMSCSDKVARWCIVGLQGALLSRLIAPVYLHSLVLGSLLHPHHMYRALCGRIEGYITSLPPPFRLHRPQLARAASTEARTPHRAPSFSVCWCCTTPHPEFLNATTGKLESGQPSLLCKQSMFARWQHLVRKLPLLPVECEMGEEPPCIPANMENLLYNEAKQLCPTYQKAKDCLTDAFEKAKLGRWIKKPIEQDQFFCEIAGADLTALFA